MKKIHELKILPGYFLALIGERKNFEVRKNDRDFKEGDILRLREWEERGYSGSEAYREITYVLNDERYCKEGYVIMGMKAIEYCKGE